MSTCNFTQVIQQQECIGDSLTKINTNFSNLDDNLCSTISNVATLSANLNASLSAVQQVTALVVPIGTIIQYAAATAPAGWLICNGVVVPNGVGTVQGQTANFANLRAVLGTTYGAAGTLPDLRGVFVRGLDQGKGLDSGRGLGSYQADRYPNHYHGVGELGSTGNDGWFIRRAWSGVGTWLTKAIDGAGSISATYTVNRASGDTGTTNQINDGTETRPKNVALVYCIKY
jgi:microcystin-dependent protein